MRVQVVERPRIASTSTSSTASSAAAFGCRAFQRSRPASASSSCRAFATVMSGWVERRRPVRRLDRPGGLAALRRRDARRLAVLLRVVRRPGRVAEPLRFLRGRELEQRRRASRRTSSIPADGVAALGEPRRRGRERERGRIAVRDLVPGERHRDARVGRRPHRLRRGDRAVLRVLVVVEEDAVALLLPPLAGREVGARAARPRARARAPRAAPGRSSSAARCAR